MASATAAMKTTTLKSAAMEAASKARPPARRKASDIPAVSKAAECAGVRSRLRVKAGAPVKTRGPMESAGVLQAAMAEITVMKPVVAKVSAM
jgi:hypothetical protein